MMTDEFPAANENKADGIGHFHAVQIIITIALQQNQIHATLRHHISTDLEVIAGTPPEKIGHQTSLMIEQFNFGDPSVQATDRAGRASHDALQGQ